MSVKTRDLGMTPLDDLFSTDESRAESQLEKVVTLNPAEISDFPNHPFKVKQDEAMAEMVESVRKYGVLVPALVRPKADGGYEMVAGHRRKFAATLAELPEIPCIVRDLTDDEATIIMVDSNLQRETILPSEKAFAYKMKLDAMKRQVGRPSKENSVPVGQNFDGKTSRELLAAKSPDSNTQIQRYIRLTELIPSILQMVDDGKIAFRPAVELSYLSSKQQEALYSTMECEDCTPSLTQAIKMKEFSKDGKLTEEVILSIMQEEKPNQKEQFKMSKERISKYFAPGTPAQKIEDTIIHPMMIVIIRLFAKLLHLENLLVDNSIIHYLIVCLSSVAFGIATTVLWNKYRPKKVRYDNDTDRAYIEIDLNNLEHNVKTLRKAMPPKCELMAVVKAQAYGHGAYEISTHLEKIGVRAFAVATIDEGISLRKYGIRGEILILGYTSIDRASELKKYNLIQTLISFEYANALNRQGVMVNAHIKIDTGMHRLGIPSADFLDVEKVFTMKNLNVCGIFTHLCCSDSSMPDDIAFTRGQIDGFYNLIDHLKKSGINIPKLHIQSSYGFLNYPELKCSYVRTGVALYGVKSLPDDNIELQLDLRPVLSLKSRVVLIRQIEKGDSVGYGRSFVAERNSRIAILPIGYGDGFPRSLSNGNGRALIGQYIVPVIGRICMDQLAIDITDAEGIAVGDIATLIDTDGCTDLSADVVAKNSNSISNELLCRMGERLPVIIKRQ